MADQVLIYADTERSPELRHEIPVAIGDAFLYAESNGSRHVLTSVLEQEKLDSLGLTTHLGEEYGVDELRQSGKSMEEIRNELVLRACRDFGIETAVVPFWFPLEIADHLRANGIQLQPDKQYFDRRRRSKSEAEIAGIRRAQKAAEAGMAAARELLRAAQEADGGLELDGEALTSERVKAAIAQAFLDRDCAADDVIVAHGAQAASGHDMGSGRLQAGETIVIDLWPRDRKSACFADMTRTFVVGEVSEQIAEWHRLSKEVIDRTLEAVKPGVKGRALHDLSCDVFEAAGYPTNRTKEPGKPLRDGFFHSLGHGVGLEVHEAPGLGLLGDKELVPGDVITLEPGLYRQGVGGVRLEDLVLVTEDGAENLTDFPYGLAP